jgi:hypothetical protein
MSSPPTGCEPAIARLTELCAAVSDTESRYKPVEQVYGNADQPTDSTKQRIPIS